MTINEFQIRVNQNLSKLIGNKTHKKLKNLPKIKIQKAKAKIKNGIQSKSTLALGSRTVIKIHRWITFLLLFSH